ERGGGCEQEFSSGKHELIHLPHVEPPGCWILARLTHSRGRADRRRSSCFAARVTRTPPASLVGDGSQERRRDPDANPSDRTCLTVASAAPAASFKRRSEYDPLRTAGHDSTLA